MRSKVWFKSLLLLVILTSFVQNAKEELSGYCTKLEKMSRHVATKFFAKETMEGNGAKVRRSIGQPELPLKDVDPFLLLDEAIVGPPAGFPDHPHRGFETVTYVVKGRIRHEDFTGYDGYMGTGDCQWLTAGRGILHSAVPVEFGHYFQIWINLPAKDKWIAPDYQELHAKDIPEKSQDGVTVRVIAGESMGLKATVYTRTPTMFLDFKVEKGASHKQAIPNGWRGYIYMIAGEAKFGPDCNSLLADAHHLLVLSDGEHIEFKNEGDELCHFILLGGQPLNEPLVKHGPFVMNTQEEIDQSIIDYREAKNGFENANTWKSKQYH